MRQKCKRVFFDNAGCISVDVLVIGYLSNNCYVVSDGTAADASTLVVDPAGDIDAIMEVIGSKNVQYIFCTHNHPDHILALPQLVERTHAHVAVSVQDAVYIESGQPELFRGWGNVAGVNVDTKLRDGDTLKIGNIEFEAIHTPGHTKGGMCLYSRGIDKPGVLFTGDTLFCGTTGRVDFEGGSADDMRSSLIDKLAKLPDDTIVYPGHEAFSTIGAERKRTIECY